jgi:hypothetical protein
VKQVELSDENEIEAGLKKELFPSVRRMVLLYRVALLKVTSLLETNKITEL